MYQPVQKTEVDTGRLTFIFFRCKSAVEELYSCVKPAADIREDTHHIWVLGARIAIEETVESISIESYFLL